MNNPISKTLFFLTSFFGVLLLYWPAMQGTPIWDDYTFMFSNPFMKEKGSYLTIIRDYAWPVSVVFQKFILSLWDKDYFNFHLLNLCLHFANSLLVYRFARIMNIRFPHFMFLVFLLHPASVITTAWIIQSKTLLSFFFGMLSLLWFIKGNRKIHWMFLAWFMFLLSVTSKSSSLTLPFIFLIMSYRTYRFKKILLLLPFFIISLWSSYRMLSSPITIEGSERAVKITTIDERPVAKVVTKHAPSKPSTAPVSLSKKTQKHSNTLTESLTEEKFLRMNFHLISQTLHYYFWQAIFPNETAPVRGPQTSRAGATEIIHLIFLILLILIFWKERAFYYLMAAHFLLLPFLGIIPAPYMTVTWVSDQHLYLILPCFLAFWLNVPFRLSRRNMQIVLSIFILLFSYKTYRTSSYYQNQIAFYESSYQFNPHNMPIAYNLSFAYLLNGDWQKAYSIISDTYYHVENNPSLKSSIFYPYVAKLYLQIRSAMEKNEH